MEIKELKNKKESELHRILADARNDLRELRFSYVNGKLKNVRDIRKNKKTVARVLTILKNRYQIAMSEQKKEK